MNKTKTIVMNNRFDSFVKAQLYKRLELIKDAYLIIKDDHGSYFFGDENSQLRACISVHNSAFYKAIAFEGSIGAAQTYMSDGWSSDNLTNVVRVFVRNQDVLDGLEGGSAWLKNSLLKIGHFFNKNSQQGSKKNIAEHYDLGNDLFNLFLDKHMMYSSAIYKNSKDDLETASEYKLKVICEKLSLNPEDNLIEIGTGWGGFAIYAAKNYGCKVTTTTISDQQFNYTKGLIEKNNLSHLITLLKEDYRNLKGKFNKLVSIEMIEAVGHQYLPSYLKKCNDLLTDDGLALIQAITIEDHRYQKALKSVDFIKQYIFPGSFIPSIGEILRVNAGSTKMKLYNLEDYGISYAYTLKAWLHRFRENLPKVQALGYDRKFQKMWEFYLCYCAGGFLERYISNVHLLFTKPKHNKSQLFSIKP